MVTWEALNRTLNLVENPPVFNSFNLNHPAPSTTLSRPSHLLSSSLLSLYYFHFGTAVTNTGHGPSVSVGLTD